MTNPPNADSPNPEPSIPGGATPPPPAPGASPVPESAPAPDYAAPPTAAYQAPPTGYPTAPPVAEYPAPGAPAYPQPGATPPGRVLSIIGLVLAFLVAPVGLIISIVALVKLSKAKQPKGLAIAGIIVGALITIFWIIMTIVLVTVAAGLIGMCAELGSGVWEVNGVTYTCG